MNDDDKIVEIRHKEHRIGGTTFGWFEIRISTPVFIGAFLLFLAICFFISKL